MAEMTRSRQPVYVRIGMLGIGTYVPSEWPVSYSVFEDHGVGQVRKLPRKSTRIYVYTWVMMKGQGVSLPDRVTVRVTHAATLSFG